MKQLRKILSVVLAVLLLTAVGAMAVAAENDGSITIRDTVQGKNYDLYKVFDLTYDGDSVAYTIADGWQDFFAAGGAGAAYITDTDSGDLNAIVVNGRLRYINVTEDNVTDFAQAALAWAAEKPADRTAAGTGEDVTVTGLPLGYYLVYPRGASTHNEYSTGSICSLTSTTPAATVRIKAAWPAIDKKIAQDGGISENTASIGDSVPYVITGEVPDMTGFTKYYYIVTDTLSKGLTYNGDLAVAINGVTLAADTHYTVETDTTAQGETVLTIVFKDFI
ncbi:MAG: isopeptide-forming domain-containing fimbrial protein, partial [Acutalibacteraceae bacterium]